MLWMCSVPALLGTWAAILTIRHNLSTLAMLELYGVVIAVSWAWAIVVCLVRNKRRVRR